MHPDHHTDQHKLVALEDRLPSEAVVSTVSDLTGTDFRELPPLSDTIDPDAFDLLLEGSESVNITFEYAGYSITAEEDTLYLAPSTN